MSHAFFHLLHDFQIFRRLGDRTFLDGRRTSLQATDGFGEFARFSRGQASEGMAKGGKGVYENAIVPACHGFRHLLQQFGVLNQFRACHREKAAQKCAEAFGVVPGLFAGGLDRFSRTFRAPCAMDAKNTRGCAPDGQWCRVFGQTGDAFERPFNLAPSFVCCASH